MTKDHDNVEAGDEIVYEGESLIVTQVLETPGHLKPMVCGCRHHFGKIMTRSEVACGYDWEYRT